MINDKEFNTKIVDYTGNRIIVKVNGHDYEVSVTPDEHSVTKVVRTQKETPDLDFLNKPEKKPEPASPGTVVSPMPGLVITVKAVVGEQINRGDTVIILETMKMESEIASSATGIVKKIFVKEQQGIREGEALIEVG